MFKVGEKVVCIDAKNANTPHPDWVGRHHNLENVVQDKVYTITGIVTDKTTTWLTFLETGNTTEFEYYCFRKLDYEFVERVLKNIKEESLTLINQINYAKINNSNTSKEL